jgi:hypothetical protein
MLSVVCPFPSLTTLMDIQPLAPTSSAINKKLMIILIDIVAAALILP